MSLIATLLLVACQRPAGEGDASVQIYIPSVQEFGSSTQNKIASPVIDYNRLCFVVNVKGNNIQTTSNSCDVERGIFQGSVGPSETLALEKVPPGNTATFEIYGLLRKSTAESCPTGLTTTFGWPVERVYFLGSAENVKVEAPTTTVDITISLPETSKDLATLKGWATSCRSKAPLLPTAGRTTLSAGILTGSQYKSYSRISDKNEIKNLQGTQYQVRNWRASVEE